MSPLMLDIPITIDGEDVIIIRDVLGRERARGGRSAEVYTQLEPARADGRPEISVDEKALLQLRDNFPGTNVYGLWQLLFANDQVPLGEEIIAFPTSEGGGVFLEMVPGSDLTSPASIQGTGEYSGGFSASHPGFNWAAAPRITVDTTLLRLPSSPAFTRSELNAKLQHEKTKRWYLTGSVCLAIVVGFAVWNYALFSMYRMDMAQYQSKKQLTNDLDARMSSLLAERLTSLPNDSNVIKVIDQVMMYDPDLTTPTAESAGNSFKGRHTFVTRPGYLADLTGKIPGVKAELMPELSYRLTVMPSGRGGSN